MMEEGEKEKEEKKIVSTIQLFESIASCYHRPDAADVPIVDVVEISHGPVSTLKAAEGPMSKRMPT